MVLRDGPERRGRARTKRPLPGSEQIEIRTADGWSLRADVHEPKDEPVGLAVMAHSLMGRRSDFERGVEGTGLVRFFVDRQWRVVVFDFRGHGESGPRPHQGANYGYDDFVVWDLPAIHAFARTRARRNLPVVLIGHSLGGHAGLAAQGVGLVAFDAVLAVGANVWLRALEASRGRWLIKRASLATLLAMCRRLDRFPARALRLGSDDVARGCCEDLERFARTGEWGSADARVDYLAALARVRVPVLQMVSDGDRIECTPECGARFVAHCGGPHEILRITRSDNGGAPPDHRGLVTDSGKRSAWERAEAWMRRVPLAV